MRVSSSMALAVAISPERSHALEFPAAERIVVVAHFNGDLDAMNQTLTTSGLLDAQGRWSGASTTLIGLGDLPLSDTKVRESLLNSGVIPDQKTVTNYREIAANDVVDPDDMRGAARRIDVERSEGLLAQFNPRAAERIATCMYVASLAPRSQGATGATDAELRVAAFVPAPECDLGEIDAVVG